ncbi:lipase class 3 [Colletotrichum incanum]|uniref:Lipase class 3 n=1 Tax=Colletotrichum incanum TaxID=1573173 RepID=A0A167C7I4_COLIC|nr:lipase class 3 [Colletotrichum incanum]
MAIDTSSYSKLHHDLAHANLERLSLHEPPQQPEKVPESIPNVEHCTIVLNLLKKWSTQNKSSIDESIASQVFGGKADISWSRAFLPFMESMGMYLRDYGMLRLAWDNYRDYKFNGPSNGVNLDTCIRQYNAAYEPIRQLAQTWGMDFVVLCDLIHSPPDGQPAWDGPYCGAFFSTSPQKDKPFIGVAFKGTNPLNARDRKVDYNYQLTDSGHYLGGTQVSLGVFTALFATFETIEDTAYNYIIAALARCVLNIPKASGSLVRAHVTGHSLGGSYSSFFYAQLLQDAGTVGSQVATGDEYTFGAPRVGSQLWATCNKNVVSASEGQSWRVVNSLDLVPQVPPTSLRPTELDFYHIDKGMKIFSDRLPEPIPSEIGKPPPPVTNFENIGALIKAVFESTYHLPNSYYNAIVFAINNTK